MGLGQKVGRALDWGKRIQFVYQVVGYLLTLSATAAVRAMIYNTHIPTVWRIPIYLFAAALTLLFVAVVGEWLGKRIRRTSNITRTELADIEQRAGHTALLLYFLARATDLLRDLEALWHQWDDAGEKLIHPLDGRIDQLKGDNWDLVSKKRDFMVLYSHHLMTLKVEFPNFSSAAISGGYPSQREYSQVRYDLIQHMEELKVTADNAWNTSTLA